MIGNAGEEDPEDPINLMGIRGEKIEFVFHHGNFQIIGDCICTAETEEVMTFLPCLNGIKVK